MTETSLATENVPVAYCGAFYHVDKLWKDSPTNWGYSAMHHLRCHSKWLMKNQTNQLFFYNRLFRMMLRRSQ